MENRFKSAKAQVRTQDLAYNLALIRAQLPAGTALCAVLKADAYGHGLPGMLRLLSRRGLVDMAAVGKLSELLQLHRAASDGSLSPGEAPERTLDLLLLGNCEAAELAPVLDLPGFPRERVLWSVYSLRRFREFSALGRAQGAPLRVHIRVDGWNTGMGLGYREFLEHEEELFNTPGVRVCGLYNHLYTSYSQNTAEIEGELERFQQFVDALRPEHRRQLRVHILNSPLIFQFPQYAFDMARTGTAMYGLPCGDGGRLRPILRVSARVFDVREVDAAAPLSYEQGPHAAATRRIARMMLGYWDSPLLLTMKDVRVRIRGRVFRLADEICMDNLCIDVTGADDIVAGDEAVLLGEPGVTVEEIMERNGLPHVHSEYLCMTAGRLEKEYL